MTSSYGNDLDWNRIELLSSAIKDTWASSFASILDEIDTFTSANVLDLGCGTGHLSSAILSRTNNKKLHYTGIDIDTDALQKAKERFNSSTFINDSALSSTTTSLALTADIVISLSNTFLCLGDHSELSEFLKNLGYSKQRMSLVLSVVPWNSFQLRYNRLFEDWYFLQNTSRECWVKVDISESSQQIEQRVHIKDNQAPPSLITHRFLKLNIDEITDLFEQSGWDILSWRSPIDGSAVNPALAELPEFFIICQQTNNI